MCLEVLVCCRPALPGPASAQRRLPLNIEPANGLVLVVTAMASASGGDPRRWSLAGTSVTQSLLARVVQLRDGGPGPILTSREHQPGRGVTQSPGAGPRASHLPTRRGQTRARGAPAWTAVILPDSDMDWHYLSTRPAKLCLHARSTRTGPTTLTTL